MKTQMWRELEVEAEGLGVAVYTACPHFYQTVSGVESGPHCQLGNSWCEGREKGGGCECGHFRIRCKNHAGPAFVKTV